MQPLYLIRSNKIDGEVRVDHFPRPPRAVHTVNIYTSDFVGTVTVEATIKLQPQASDWFVVHEEVFAVMNSNEQTRRNRTVNLTGVFTSMRASFVKANGIAHGLIDRVTVI
jgi:hypothetical protein